MSTQTLCDVFLVNLLKGVENFNTGTPYTYKVALYDSSSSLDATTTAYTTTGEIVDTNYTAGGATLSPTVPVLDSGTALVSFADVVWNPATFTAHYALVYNATTQAAVCVLDFGADKTAVNTFTIQFPTATGTTAIIRIS